MIIGLDVGSTKVAVVVGQVIEDGQISVIGLGQAPSLGIRKGMVVDIDATTKAIRSAVEKAEQMSGVEIESAFVSVGGPHIACSRNRAVVAVSREDQEISTEDTQRVLQAAKLVPLSADRKVIHVLPCHYTVDGYGGIVDPVGMYGSRLEVESQIITGAGNVIQNLLKSVYKGGVEVIELVASPLASAEAVLMPAERELGVVLVDIGGGTSEIAIFDEGGLWFTSVIPVGGSYLTSDLAVGLRTPLDEAERLKQEHGTVSASEASDEDLIEVPNVGMQESRQVSLKMVASILEPRAQEICGLIRQELKRSGYGELIPGGIVLTGGVSQTRGLGDLLARELGFPVRLGRPANVGGLVDMVNLPSLSTACGLMIYGAQRAGHLRSFSEKHSWSKAWDKISNWFKELISMGIW